MAKSSATVTKASQSGGVNGVHGAVDCLSLTDAARVRIIHITPAAITQNATTTAYVGNLGVRGIILAVYGAAATVPIVSGGTVSWNVRVSVAGAAAVTQATIDPTALTALIGGAATLQTTNDALVIGATDYITVTSVCSNNSVGTAEVGPKITIMFLPLEASDGSALQTGTAAGL